MNQKNQLLALIVLLVVIAVSVVIVLPNRTPGEVEIVSTETGDSVLVSDYVARYSELERNRTEDGGYVLGSPDAPVTIVEFADFMCPHCQNYHEVARQFIEQYVATGKAKFEYRLFPIVNPQLSIFTAQLAECADTQQPGLFWAAHDFLYDLAARGQINRDRTPSAMVETLKLDAAALTTCMATATQHQTDTAVGDAAGVNGTPATLVRLDDGTLGWGYVDGQVYNRGGMPLSVLQKVVEAKNLSDVVFVPEPLLNHLIVNDETDCAVPCWRGITPGETTWNAASELARSGREFTSFQEQTDPSGAKALLWYSVDGLQCCRMISETGATADEVFMLAQATVTMGAVIEAHGEPAYAIARETEGGGLLINVFYTEPAMLLYVFLGNSAGNSFTADSEVVGVSYLATDRMTTIITELDPTAWAGFTDPTAYMFEVATATEEAEVSQSTEAVTPQITATEDVTPEVTP